MSDNQQTTPRPLLKPIRTVPANPCDMGPLSWNEFLTAQDFFPERAEDALLFIRIMLGYMPPRHVTGEQELFIRAVIDYSFKNNVDSEALYDQLEPHCKKIRNSDMKNGKWADTLSLTAYHLSCYHQHLPHLREKARQRLVHLLGYEPALAASLPAELLLRESLSSDRNPCDTNITPEDCKAVTITHYRGICIEAGREQADDLPVIGLLYNPGLKCKEE